MTTNQPPPPPQSWQSIRLPFFERTAFSPETGDGFSGIVIWVPPKVQWKEHLRIPVFGVVQLTQAQLQDMKLRDSHPLRAAIVGMVDAEHHDPYVGNVVREGVLFPTESSIRVREYFNVDLFETTGTPCNPGKYFVCASMGPHTAPVVEVEVIG